MWRCMLQRGKAIHTPSDSSVRIADRVPAYTSTDALLRDTTTLRQRKVDHIGAQWNT